MRRLIPVFLLPVAVACGSKSDATDAASTVADKVTSTETSAINALASAYPGTLALSVFPSSSTGLALGDAAPQADTTGTDRPPEQKIAEAEKRLKGEGECFDPGQQKDGGEHQERCYEFDSDMNRQISARDLSTVYGTADGKDGAGVQACMATFANKEVNTVISIVDRSLAQVQGVFCVEKKAAEKAGRDVRKPTVDGDALDLTDVLTATTPTGAPKFLKAEVLATADADTGVITYTTSITVQKPNSTQTDAMVLRHTPAQEGLENEEAGVLTYVRSGNTQEPKNAVLSLKYKKTIENDVEKMRAELVRAMIATKYEPLTADGFVNYAALPVDATNDDVGGSRLVSFDVVPETGAGSISYWNSPGGALQESARGFIFNLTADSEGLLSGCGISGATDQVSIRKSAIDTTGTVKLSPAGFWHPFQEARNGQAGNTATGQNPAYGTPGKDRDNKITQQCVKQDAQGIYAIDLDKTTDKTFGYDVIAGSLSSVLPPTRPPEFKLPPPPPKS